MFINAMGKPYNSWKRIYKFFLTYTEFIPVHVDVPLQVHY